jgi:hypothetical protein
LAGGSNYFWAVLAEDTNSQLISQFSNQTNFLAPGVPIAPVLKSLKTSP